MTYDITFTDEDVCKSLMEELEELTDEEWTLLNKVRWYETIGSV